MDSFKGQSGEERAENGEKKAAPNSSSELKLTKTLFANPFPE